MSRKRKQVHPPTDAGSRNLMLDTGSFVRSVFQNIHAHVDTYHVQRRQMLNDHTTLPSVLIDMIDALAAVQTYNEAIDNAVMYSLIRPLFCSRIWECAGGGMQFLGSRVTWKPSSDGMMFYHVDNKNHMPRSASITTDYEAKCIMATVYMDIHDWYKFTIVFRAHANGRLTRTMEESGLSIECTILLLLPDVPV